VNILLPLNGRSVLLYCSLHNYHDPSVKLHCIAFFLMVLIIAKYELALHIGGRGGVLDHLGREPQVTSID
jgi:hypothetical protein